MPGPTLASLCILILGSVIMSLILILVCGKRKLIQRKECSRRDPHVPGVEATKSLKKEIEKRIDRVYEISYEPQLLHLEAVESGSSDIPPYYFRMKAVDNMKYLESEISTLNGVVPRTVMDNMRSFLINQTSPGGVLETVESRLVHELSDRFDHARHHPASFSSQEFTLLHSMIIKILQSARNRSKTLSRGVTTVPSDHDSAIGDPDIQEASDDENLIFNNSMTIMQRPSSLNLFIDEETSV